MNFQSMVKKQGKSEVIKSHGIMSRMVKPSYSVSLRRNSHFSSLICNCSSCHTSKK